MNSKKKITILGILAVLCIGMVAAVAVANSMIKEGKLVANEKPNVQQADNKDQKDNKDADNKQPDNKNGDRNDNKNDDKEQGKESDTDKRQEDNKNQDSQSSNITSSAGKGDMSAGKDDGLTDPGTVNPGTDKPEPVNPDKPEPVNPDKPDPDKPDQPTPGEIAILETLAERKEAVISKGYLNWNFSDGIEGFYLSDNSYGKLQQKYGVLGWEITNGGQLMTPSGLAIPTSSVSTIELRLMSTASKTLTVYWKKSGDAFREASKATISISGDGKFHDYQIELGQHTEWDGVIDQLKFVTEDGGKELCFDFIRLSGIYIVPFPFFSGDFNSDLNRLNEIKETYSNLAPGVILGYSARIEYLADTDENGDYAPYAGKSSYMNLVDPDYYLKLAKAADMPVMIWLRGDPWGDWYVGAYRELRLEDNNYMWTSALDGSHVYRREESGYAYLSLAQKNLDGEETDYWKKTDHLLDQCARVIAKLTEENPDNILGVTTTSELKYNGNPSDESYIDLDYNPNTILEFAEYCQKKYGTIEKLNQTVGTSFTTFTLRSMDYDPTTVETPGGFDAPRNRNSNSAFWKEWKAFRATQVTAAVTRQVNTIGKYLDSKYIYTHQIAIGEDPFVSPEEAGDVIGSNVGIDMFNHEVTLPMIKKIASFVAEDPSRTWGVPEWLVMSATSYETTYASLEIMDNYGVKYLCPFNWGSNDIYDLRGTDAEKAIVAYLRNLKTVSYSNLSKRFKSANLTKIAKLALRYPQKGRLITQKF